MPQYVVEHWADPRDDKEHFRERDFVKSSVYVRDLMHILMLLYFRPNYNKVLTSPVLKWIRSSIQLVLDAVAQNSEAFMNPDDLCSVVATIFSGPFLRKAGLKNMFQ